MDPTSRKLEAIEALLARVLACAPEQRAVLLDQVCGTDPAYRQRMDRLLRLAESGEGFLDRTPLRDGAEVPAGAAPPGVARRVGAYRLVRKLGSGGSAEVWLAERDDGGFAQRAAVKLVRDADAATRARFAIECGILASLEHPGIARLYEADVDARGSAYLVIEYVEGEHLTAYARRHGLPLRERLELFLQVCDAVAYAHTRLVVHRDIKPANILVGADGRVKLLDFGIAKLLDQDGGRNTTQTLHLSPAYAAPEQLTGGHVGTSTDVHALGVTLFELLTGTLPWSVEGAPMTTALRRLAERPLPPPSRHAGAGGVAARALRGDLDAIVRRALRSDAAARYPDARALADDVRRHLAHEPVAARAGATGYHLRRFVRRHWLGLASAGAVFAAMAIALGGIAWQADKARAEARSSAAVQAFLVDLFRHSSSRQADPVKARATTARELLDIGVERIQHELDDAPAHKLALLRLFGDLYGEFALSAAQVPVRRTAVPLSRRVNGGDSRELAADLIALADVSPDDAEQQSSLAEAGAILDRLGDRDSVLRAKLLVTRASSHVTTDMASAANETAGAVAILERMPPSDDLAQALYLQGLVAGYSARMAQAVGPLQRAVDVALASDGAHNPMLSTYYRQLGEAQSYTSRHDAARASLEHAIAQARAFHDENDYDLVRAQTTMAATLLNADRPREALEAALQAKAAAPTADHGIEAMQLRTYALGMASRAAARAGDAASALADAEAAVALARDFDPTGAFLGISLQRLADAQVELGRDADAERALAEATDILTHAGRRPSEASAMLRIRIALDAGRVAGAREQFASLPALDGDALSSLAAALRRDLVEAELELAEGLTVRAITRAADVVARARASELAPFLRSTIADGAVLEARARLLRGDAARARPLLADALAARHALYLPTSPRIAEAALALAEAEFALGLGADARSHLDQAEAIAAQAGLAARWVAALQHMRRLATATATPHALAERAPPRAKPL
ncbi:serine/threonine-protein kinase [Dokdonella fugitiva]|uniref:Serine/threonine-protein kinase n=1 Tax=Dokdonella fugitiva TaxID=328517 RepID=A0A4R2IG59_9GAMM|nr:serine/threonine-protein kinase [Dokdonella fugitiva]TCO43196.1 serine/threonine-protein kinase [Dokdonella fugitiva]